MNYIEYTSNQQPMTLHQVERQVAIIQTWQPAYDEQGNVTHILTLELHGATKTMVERAINFECKDIFQGYTLEYEYYKNKNNGRCYRTLVLTIRQPNLQLLSAEVYPSFIKTRMERFFACCVTIFTDYEKFINT